jgi:hypothetical protein
MTRRERKQNRMLTSASRAAAATLALMILLVMSVAAAPAAHAQTFTVLHNFEGGEGAQPQAGLIMDRAGNFYGTTPYGGDTEACSGEAGGGGLPPGCGVVYKLKKSGSSWILNPVYLFGTQQYQTNSFLSRSGYDRPQ